LLFFGFDHLDSCSYTPFIKGSAYSQQMRLVNYTYILYGMQVFFRTNREKKRKKCWKNCHRIPYPIHSVHFLIDQCPERTRPGKPKSLPAKPESWYTRLKTWASAIRWFPGKPPPQWTDRAHKSAQTT